MLIPDAFTKYGIRPNGILHVGAHYCEERSIYNAAGVPDERILWVEANPDIVRHVKSMDPRVDIVQGVASDKEEDVVFKITNNGQSSSFLALAKHADYHPDIVVTREVPLRTSTIPALLAANGKDVKNYDFLVMDIQGAELHALRGMEDELAHFNGVYLEVNDEELYAGCGLFPEIEALLAKHGFRIVEKRMTQAQWGDALFLRRAR